MLIDLAEHRRARPAGGRRPPPAAIAADVMLTEASLLAAVDALRRKIQASAAPRA